MSEALFWGTLGASSLLLGSLIAARFRIRRDVLGLVMAFGSGVLISAVAYELVEEAFDTAGGSNAVGFGLAAGALTFFAGTLVLNRRGGDPKAAAGPGASSGMAIVLGAVLDGIPESIVLGLTLLTGEGVSVAMLAAVFMSNLPEAIGATTDLVDGGWRRSRVILLWAVVVAVSGLSSLLGYALLDGASPWTIAFVNSFAAGAILTMLADTMMPEAFEEGGVATGLATTFGFGAAFFLSSMGG